MSGEIQTVLGPLPAEALGPTLMHEHVINVSPGIWRTWPELVGGQEAFLAEATSLLTALRDETGVTSIVDLSSADIGRDAELLRELSRRSGMHIVLATGHHRHFTLTTAHRSVAEFQAWFTREIEVGTDGTVCRAGVIKVASDQGGVRDTEERVLRAAARTHLATGIPISAHSYAPEAVGLEQLDILESEGVPPDRVCIGHCDDLATYDYTLRLAERGCWLGLDRYPGGPSHLASFETDWKERVALFVRLVDDGFAGQILLSHDHSLALTVVDPAIVDAYFAQHPDGPFFIHRFVIPRLLSLGVDEKTVDGILTDNPRRFLVGV